MLSFQEFSLAAPEIAEPIHTKLTATGIGLYSTLRSDGWPRISPMETSFVDDGLFVGSMPGAVKALDLRRDPRCCLLTPLADKDDLGGEGKLFLHARELTDPDELRRVLGAAIEGIEGADLDSFDGSHMFEMRVVGGAWQALDGEAWTTTSWREGDRVRHFRREGPAGTSTEVDAPTG